MRRTALSPLAVLVFSAVLLLATVVRGEAWPGEDAVWPRQHEATVVLLHGLGRSPRNLQVLEWRLASRGYRVLSLIHI